MEFRKKIKKIIINLFSFFFSSKKSKSIFYHDLHSDKKFTEMSTSLNLFEEHINTIRSNGFQIVHQIEKDKGQIEISFDDGFKGLYENISLINKLEVPVTIFVITSFIDKDNFLSKRQIEELVANPFIRFASHTHTHQDLSLLSEKELKFELIESKKILQEICQTEIESICYPNGFFSNDVFLFAKNADYKTQYSSLPGNYYNKVFPSLRNRSLVQFASRNEFNNILHGGDNILNIWYKFKHYRT